MFAFEYLASGGQVTARCVCPQHLTRFVSAALHNALPGVQIDVEEAPDLNDLGGRAAVILKPHRVGAHGG